MSKPSYQSKVDLVQWKIQGKHTTESESYKMSDTLITGLIERPPKTSAAVAERLQNLILTKELEPGSKLPPERSLCRQLGVSRTVLREAIKLLSARGLVDEIAGKGTYVSEPNFEAVKKSLQVCLKWYAEAVFENLVQLRQLIEVEIAGLAASEITEQEISELRDNIKEMESVLDGDIDRYIELDLDFHARIASATHNDLFVALFEAIAGAMVARWKKMYWDTEVRKSGLSLHKKILEAIERRIPQEARRVVRGNIETFQRDVASHS